MPVNLLLWIVAILLALVFLAAGLTKLTRPKDKLVGMGMGWAAAVGDGQVKLLGTAEILGALGLILPRLTGIAPVLTPIAAIGLAIVMLGAIVVHVRRHEAPLVLGVVILFALCVLLAVGRF